MWDVEKRIIYVYKMTINFSFARELKLAFEIQKKREKKKKWEEE